MHETERTEFVQAVAALAVSFRKEATEALFTGYWWGLEDLPLATVKRAISDSIRTCKFMPTPAELRELAGIVKPDDRAVIAFATVDKAVQVHGYYRSVSFDDPYINAAIRTLGGWEALCIMFDTEEAKWIEQRFRRTYTALCRAGHVGEELMAPLLGYIDRVNGVNGWSPERIKALGCEARQTALIETGLPALPVERRLLTAEGEL